MDREKDTLNTSEGLLFVLLSFFAISVFLYRVFHIFSFEYPEDWDSFYYLLQFKILRTEGYQPFVTPGSLAILSIICKFLDLSDSHLFYLFVTISHLSFATSILFFGYRGAFFHTAFFCAFWVLSSQTLFLDTFSHPRQTLALSFVVWGMAFYFGETWIGKWRAAILWMLASLTHPFAAVISFAIGWGRFKDIGRLSAVWRWALGLFCVVSLFIISSPARVLKISPHLLDPWTLMTKTLKYSDVSKIEFGLMLVGAAIFLLGTWRSKSKSRLLPIGLVLLLCIAPIWRLNVSGSLAIRLISSAYWPLIFGLLEINYERKFHSMLLTYLSFLSLVLIMLNAYSPGLPTIDGPRFPSHLLSQYQDQIKSWMGKGAYVNAPFGVHSRVIYFLGYHSWNAPAKNAYPSTFTIRHSTADIDCSPVDSVPLSSTTPCIRIDRDWIIVKDKEQGGDDS